MKEKLRDKISEDALLLFPLWKRLFRGDSNDPALTSLRNQTYHILRILEKKGPLSVSAIGKQLFIAKQNMTTFIDRLMNEGLVERKHDTADRRVINIVITEKGRSLLTETRESLKRIVKENLTQLSDEDIESLHDVFAVIRTIIHKLG